MVVFSTYSVLQEEFAQSEYSIALIQAGKREVAQAWKTWETENRLKISVMPTLLLAVRLCC
jgi:hypothetical protein